MRFHKIILILSVLGLLFGSSALAATTTYEYDSLNRLIRAEYSDGKTVDYTYDNAGNRMSIVKGPEPGEEGLLQVLIQKGPSDPMGGINVYLFNSSGSYLGMHDVTDESGRVDFTVPIGTYKVRADYLGYQFWGEEVQVIGETDLTVQMPHQPVEITVRGEYQGTYDPMQGLKVYLFTPADSYLGQSSITNTMGKVTFDLPEKAYKVRGDYLSQKFWSNNFTWQNTTINIPMGYAEITVTVAGQAKEGVKVYLFSENGTYLGINGVTDAQGKVSFKLPAGHTFKFRADYLSQQYWSDDTLITADSTNSVDLDTGGGSLTVTFKKDNDDPIPDIKLYLFSSSGTYLGHHDTSDENGQVSYVVSGGDYKVRADYMGYQFWTNTISVNSSTSYDFILPHQDVTITINSDYDGDVQPKEGLNAYLFTASGTYLGKFEVTDPQGQVVFNLPQQDYKVRTDYLSQQYWSDAFNWTNETITINEGMAEVTVTNMGMGLEGIQVYVFNNSGTYLGIYDVSDSEGKVSFKLPEGGYNFRADYLGSQYWSGHVVIISHTVNPIQVSTSGGSFTLTLLKGPGEPLVGINCYLFNDAGTYLGKHGATNGDGEVSFNLADGTYKIRIDYMGYQFWTDLFNVPASTSMTHTVSHQDVIITVVGDYDGDVKPFEGLKVYLFTSSGSYLGQSQTTNTQGQVVFNLPEQDYKVRADYLSQQYWSEVFDWTNKTITINEGVAEIHVTQGASPLENVYVYIFSSSGSYLGIKEQTDQNGVVALTIPEGTYKFRADFQNNQYWATELVNAHQVNVINIDTGGGAFVLTVQKGAGAPLTSTPVYVFNESGSYLGINDHTDNQGQVSFDLSDGNFKFRVDYLGYQFWTQVYTVPQTLSDLFTIPHQDVTITVNQVYGTDVNPMENIRVYLFKESGSYLGKYENTNAQGQVLFNLPEMNYKVRADYMSSQYWSDVFSWQDQVVNIDHGKADIHVTFNGEDVVDAPVYLFTESGSYLGTYERTNTSGHALFNIPAKAYKFRVDYNGTQYWSDVINVIAHEETDIELPLDQLTLKSTNDPGYVWYARLLPEFRWEPVQVVSLLER